MDLKKQSKASGFRPNTSSFVSIKNSAAAVTNNLIHQKLYIFILLLELPFFSQANLGAQALKLPTLTNF